jgi:NADPH:quinone reductase-like Zn-dependent oxidoreductase
MRAVVQRGYGGPEVYEVGGVAEPSAGPGEVLVGVRAASLHPDIWHVMAGRPYVMRLMGSGLRRPRWEIPGTDLAGVVAAVGPGVTGFSPGDEVYGEALRGHQWCNGGTFAGYAVVKESALARKPEGLTMEEAAALPTAGLIAHQALFTEGQVKAGHRVLVNGAAGGVGSLVVQLARSVGASVTAVDLGRRLDGLAGLGAERVIDGGREDYTAGAERYDVVVDIPGNRPFSAARRILGPGGVYVLVAHDHFGATGGAWLGSVPRALGLTLASLWTPGLPGLRGAKPDPGRWSSLAGIAAGGAVRPRVSEVLDLAEIRQAMGCMVEGKTPGRIVLRVS